MNDKQMLDLLNERQWSLQWFDLGLCSIVTQDGVTKPVPDIREAIRRALKLAYR